MKFWMVSREYAGIAEAGGVKNVVCSLSEELTELHNEVTLFIPKYKCTDFSNIKNYNKSNLSSESIQIGDKSFNVSFSTGKIKNVNIVFINSSIYDEKNNVYTYSSKDLEDNPNCGGTIGCGYNDWLYLDILFQKAICVYAQKSKLKCDIVHCHDACCAMLPVFAKVFFEKDFDCTKFIVTIHNAGPAYHHEFCDIDQAKYFTNLPYELLSNGLNGCRVEPYILASFYSKLSTVSFDYAKELLDENNTNSDGLSKIFSERKISITGITNGIDINRYSPEDKSISLLPFEFSPEKKDLKGKIKCRKFFLENYAKKENSQIIISNEKIKQFGYINYDENSIFISFHGRLVRQKGIFVILDLLDRIFEKEPNVKFIINGQGESYLQDELANKAKKYAGKIVYLCGYEKSLARLCTASGDFALFPSDFEPCGLEDFIAQIYGTIPVAHFTGGLKKIINGKTGFTYSPNTAEILLETILPLINHKIQQPSYYDSLISNTAKYLKENYTWKTVTKNKYIPFFNS